jgi:hypothetical protein
MSGRGLSVLRDLLTVESATNRLRLPMQRRWWIRQLNDRASLWNPEVRMETIMVSGPAPVELEVIERGPDFGEVLADAVKRADIRQEAEHFASLCSTILADLRLIRELDPVIYLIDFDVIRNLIDSKPLDRENQRQALRMFENADFQYAIPIGAFTELLVWLRSFAPTYVKAPPPGPVASGNRKDALRQLALAVSVWPDNPNESELIREIAVAAASLTDITKVLLSCLERKNFRAVFCDYDEESRSTWQEILEDSQRHEAGRPRDIRDYRDSQNLAVLSQGANARQRGGRQGKAESQPPESFVLLTQTSILLDLVHKLEREQQWKMAQLLAKLFGRSESAHDESRVLYPSGFPVMTSQRASFVEELREGRAFARQSRSMVESMKRIFEKLSSILEVSDESYPTAANVKIDQLRSCISELNDFEGSRFYRTLFVDRLLSQDRSDTGERQPPRLGSQNRIESSAAGLMLAETTVEFFYRSLTALNQRLKLIAPTRYQLVQKLHPTGSFSELTVLSTDPNELVMKGECYIDRIEESDVSVAYSFRWQTTAQERRFFAALQAIFAIVDAGGQAALPPDLTLRQITGEEDQPQEGMLYFTNAGVFWGPLQEVFLGLSRGIRALEKVKRTIARMLQRSDEEQSKASPVEAELKLHAVRVQTAFGDFQIDLAEDDSGAREVFVITTYNIGEQIAFLCEATSMLGVITERLNETLQVVTASFPRYEQALKETAS